jgi:hypothetical protein
MASAAPAMVGSFPELSSMASPPPLVGGDASEQAGPSLSNEEESSAAPQESDSATSETSERVSSATSDEASAEPPAAPSSSQQAGESGNSSEPNGANARGSDEATPNNSAGGEGNQQASADEPSASSGEGPAGSQSEDSGAGTAANSPDAPSNEQAASAGESGNSQESGEAKPAESGGPNSAGDLSHQPEVPQASEDKTASAEPPPPADTAHSPSQNPAEPAAAETKDHSPTDQFHALGEIKAALQGVDMQQAEEDFNALQRGTLTRDQLPADRRENLQKLMSVFDKMSKNIDFLQQQANQLPWLTDEIKHDQVAMAKMRDQAATQEGVASVGLAVANGIAGTIHAVGVANPAIAKPYEWGKATPAWAQGVTQFVQNAPTRVDDIMASKNFAEAAEKTAALAKEAKTVVWDHLKEGAGIFFQEGDWKDAIKIDPDAPMQERIENGKKAWKDAKETYANAIAARDAFMNERPDQFKSIAEGAEARERYYNQVFVYYYRDHMRMLQNNQNTRGSIPLSPPP